MGELFQKCIWMEAGMVQYKLCDRNYDCDSCELYKSLFPEMPNNVEKFSPQSPRKCHHLVDLLIGEEDKDTYVEQFFIHTIPGLIIHLDRYYVPPFFWFFISHSAVIMGILPIWESIIPAEAKFYHNSNTQFSPGAPVGYFRFGSYSIPLPAPFQIKVHSILTSEKKSGITEEKHHFPIWMIHLPERDGLERKALPLDCILDWYLAILKTVKKYLYMIQMNYSQFMGDGGEPVLNLSRLLPPEEFQELIGEITTVKILH